MLMKPRATAMPTRPRERGPPHAATLFKGGGNLRIDDLAGTDDIFETHDR